jgi:hypothetical protein
MDWILGLLITSLHHSELKVIIAPQLITIHRSSQHTLSFSPACCAFNSHSLAMAYNGGGSLAFRAHVANVRPIYRKTELLSTVNSTTAPSLLSHLREARLKCQPSTELSHSQLNCTQPALIPRYIASERTQQETPPPTVTLL